MCITKFSREELQLVASRKEVIFIAINLCNCYNLKFVEKITTYFSFLSKPVNKVRKMGKR